MSRFALCTVLVVACAVQYAYANLEFDTENFLQQAEKAKNSQNGDEEIPFVVLPREKRSSKSKPDVKVLRSLKKNTRASQRPCECLGAVCTCCAKFSIDGKSDEGCASFRVPSPKTRNQFVRYSFNFNDQTAQAQAPTGRDPKGMCQPFPRYPGSQICSRFHSTGVENGKVRFCLVMEAKYQGYTFYQMDFNCVTYDVENQKQVGNK